jgi:hypothetical protein
MAAHAGIYSRSHQSAKPSNLLIDHNVVVQTGDAAIRIINEPAADSASPTIRIEDNQLHPRKSAAISVNIAEQTVALDNRGRGQRVPMKIDNTWLDTDTIDWSLPRDDGHPAWKHLDRKSLRELLFAE